MKKEYAPRKANFMGMAVIPSKHGDTWLEGEEMNRDYGCFNRRGLVRHAKTKELVKVCGDVPDTYFTIPATTETEIGYVRMADNGELEFFPYAKQDETPAEFRKRIKRAYI